VKNEESKNEFDFDYIVIGAGFGGSVSAMRLTQKGYSVGIIESGQHWRSDQFPKTNLNIPKSSWLPWIGAFGVQRLNLLEDALVLSGAGVGGGSLNYAAVLYMPPDVVLEKESMQRLGGKEKLTPYYDLAGKMLGKAENPNMTISDDLVKEVAIEIGKGDTFEPVPAGIYFGQEGIISEDPYFFGEGPDRQGCKFCGECMTGCKHNAKNSLDKNYLYFAEKFGAQIFSNNKVIDIEPIGEDGSGGYVIRTKEPKSLFGKNEFRAKGIIMAAGTMGTMSLLLTLKDENRLPNLSDHLGKYGRTNSEAIVSVKSKNNDVNYSKGIAASSSTYPDDVTHIATVKYGKGHDMIGTLMGILTDGGGFIPRIVKAFFNALFHPISFLRILNPFGFAYKTILLVVMQTEENFINFKRKRRIIWPFWKTLTSEYPTSKKNPTFIPVASDFGRRLGKKMDGDVMNVTTENLFNAPLTAHIMGGCSIGQSPGDGVIDEENHVLNYKNMLVCDGSQVPENLGVNPSLTIVAFAERAMSFIQPKGDKVRHLVAEEKWGIQDILLQSSKHEKLM
jgi:cholesterol oxidase